MSARRKSRKRAVDAVFAADIRKQSPLDLLAAVELNAADRQNQEGIFAYAREIVAGVIQHHAEIDDSIAAYSRNWPIERMPAVDRAILRVAVWELKFSSEVPDAVAISEAVELAKELSTDDSGAFINGILGNIANTKRAI